MQIVLPLRMGSAHFGSTDTKVGTTQRRFAWSLCERKFTKRSIFGFGGELSWEFGISRLLYADWINSKILLYSTGNYIQYPVISYNGKEY